MSWFWKNNAPHKPFSKNEKVIAVVDLPGVPAGTRGRVKMVNGFSWQRYWVFFENGIQLGQIDKSLLARPRDRELLLNEAVARIDARTAIRDEQVSQQGVLLEQLRNPTPDTPAPDTTDTEPTDNDTTPPIPDEPTDTETIDSPSTDSTDTESTDTDTTNTPTEPATADPAPVSQGSALVDVPDHLLQRSAEARTRLA